MPAGNQIVLQVGGERQVTGRYLWGPAVDQILADEQVAAEGESGAHRLHARLGYIGPQRTGDD